MKNNKSGIQSSLHDYYYQEVLGGIEQIENSLPKLEQEPKNREYLQQIIQSAQYIADLAMIHGYEGVEAIAEKIMSTIYSLLDTEEDLDKSYCPKVQAAISAIRQVLNMEEDIESLMTVDKFDEQIELGQENVQGYTETLSKSFSQFFTNQLELPFEYTNKPVIEVNKIAENNNLEHNHTQFDICEIDDFSTLEDEDRDLGQFDSDMDNSIKEKPDSAGKFGKILKSSIIRIIKVKDLIFSALRTKQIHLIQ